MKHTITDLDPRRQRVVDEAVTWLRTPYAHMGRVKGGGIDCLTLFAEVYSAVGLIERPEIEFYAPDWNLHRDAERYLEGIMRYAREIEGPPEPGDIAIWKFGRCFAHGAIVISWPQVLHAWHDAGVLYAVAGEGQLANREARFFSPF